MSRSEIAIVGGGVAGLVAAMHIGAAGGKAVLFEASPRLGGRAQTRVVEGFCLNQGPHALYIAGAFHAALREFGVIFEGKDPDLPNGKALWKGTAYPFPSRASGGQAEPLDAVAAAALAQFMGRVAVDSDFGRGLALRVAGTAIC